MRLLAAAVPCLLASNAIAACESLSVRATPLLSTTSSPFLASYPAVLPRGNPFHGLVRREDLPGNVDVPDACESTCENTLDIYECVLSTSVHFLFASSPSLREQIGPG